MRDYDAVIFDFGRVLTAFAPDRIARGLFGNQTRALNVRRAVFSGRTWQEMEQGLLTEAQADAILKETHPDEAEDIRQFFRRYKEFLHPIPSGADILRKVKHAGLEVYGLVNASIEAWEESLRRHDFVSRFDGVVVSSREKLLKPDPAIFNTLLDRYGLEARACIFIDANPCNVESARRLGLDGIHFENHRQLESALEKRGVFAPRADAAAIQSSRQRLAVR